MRHDRCKSRHVSLAIDVTKVFMDARTGSQCNVTSKHIHKDLNFVYYKNIIIVFIVMLRLYCLDNLEDLTA